MVPFRRKKKAEERKGSFLESLEKKYAKREEEEAPPATAFVEKRPISVTVRESADISPKQSTAKGTLTIRNETGSPVLSVEVKLSDHKSTSIGKDRIFIPILSPAGEPGSEHTVEYTVSGKVELPIEVEGATVVEGAREDAPVLVKGEQSGVRIIMTFQNKSDSEISNIRVRRTLPKQFSIISVNGLEDTSWEGNTVSGSTGLLLPGRIHEVVIEAEVTPTDRNPVDLGELEISAELDRAISGLSVASVSGSAKILPSVKTIKKPENPDVWEVTLEVENPNDYSVRVSGNLSPKAGEILAEETSAYGFSVEGGKVMIDELVIAEHDRRSIGPIVVKAKDVPKFSINLRAEVAGEVRYISEVRARKSFGSIPVLWAEASKSAKAVHSGIYKELLKADEVPSSGRTPVEVEIKVSNRGSAEIGYILLEERLPPGFELPQKAEVKRKGQTIAVSPKLAVEGADIGTDRTFTIELSGASLGSALGPGESITIRYTMTAVSPPADEMFPLTSTVRISTDPDNKLLEIPIGEEKAPAVKVIRIVRQVETSKDLKFIGPDTFEVQIRVRNDSNIPLLNYTVTEKVPPEFQVIQVSQQGQKSQSQRGTIISWKLKRLEPGEEVLLSYQVRGKGEYRPEDLLKIE